MPLQKIYGHHQLYIYPSSMKKAGRGQGGALLRTAAKKNQTFSMKRLMRDYQEIQKNNLPTVGITAKPLDHDMYLWHANLKGPEGTLYEGGVFHLEMKIPTSYPHHPPQIRMLTNVSHPNIFGNYICLDMLKTDRGEEGSGWSSVYSIQSVLMQLQSFLFEEDLSLTKNQKQIAIKKAVKEANEYKCTTRNCKHGGKLSCYPPFNVKETDLKEFVTIDDQNELIQKELVCYHTKHTFKEKQLGLGLKISKLPRTGGIREAEAMFDYISIKAFLKESINWSSQNEKFTHWLPLYFGKKDNPEKFYKFLTHALSMIITNSTENFKPEYILEVLPKIMVTLIFYIMDEKKHPSIRIIRILTHIHAMFLFLVQKHPEIENQIIHTIENFIKNEKSRIKDVTPNLAVILMIASVTDKFKFSDIAQAYFEELMDRQILWILMAIPELGEGVLDETKTAIAFKAKITSFQMMCFNKLFLTEICQMNDSKKELLQHYEENFCKLRNDEETEFQKKIMAILKNVNDFSSFFEYVGLPKKTPQELSKLLQNAIKNSENKKYHGEFDKINKLAPTEDQILKYNERFETYTKFFSVQSLKVSQSNKNQSSEYKVDVKEKESTEDDWKTLCLHRWTWIKEQVSNNPSISSSELSKTATSNVKNINTKSRDRITTLIQDKYRNSYISYDIPEVQLPQVSWKMLYLRLDLEEFLSLIDMNPNFPELYNKLEVCKLIKLNTLIIPLVNVSNIKSGFYYLTSILSKLNTLEYIEVCGNIGTSMEAKAARSLKKGFNNFKDNNGNCRFFSCSNFYLQRQLSDCLYGHLVDMKNIESINFKSNNLLEYNLGCKVFCHYLTELTKIKELKLNECTNLRDGKLVADALMRMKTLEILEYQQNPARSGLPAIIYNLSFSPHFKYLNFSNTYVDVNETKEIVASLEKLLKISGSIEVISASRIAALNTNLTKDFWVTVGECRSLRVIDVSRSGIFDNTNIQYMGTAIAFNAKKKGNLQYFSLAGCLSGQSQIGMLYNSMKISEYDEESWYGDPGKVAKMIANNYTKTFYNNLKALQLQDNSNLNPNFNLAYYNKHTTKKTPEWVNILRESTKLETLDLSNTQQQKNLAEILYLALDERLPNLDSKIKVLNLSKNRLGKEGAKLLAEVIEHNHFLEVIDISKNQIGVSGAQALSFSLKKNKSVKFINLFNNKITFDGAKAFAENVLPFNTVLEFLEIGHNRIRDKGLKALTDGIIKNPQSNIKSLGLRFNFLTKSGIQFLLVKLSENKNKVENVFIRNNLLDEFGTFFLNKIYSEKNLKLYVDVFEKLKYLDSERMQRSIWVHPIGANNRQQFKQFFEVTHPCGIVLDVRIRTGKKYPNKTGPNSFAIVEFADPSSVKHALYIASQRWTNLNGMPFRVYKSGTGTFFYMKKTSKQRSIENAKMLLPPLPFDTPDFGAKVAQERRARGRGRGRGRGAKR